MTEKKTLNKKFLFNENFTKFLLRYIYLLRQVFIVECSNLYTYN